METRPARGRGPPRPLRGLDRVRRGPCAAPAPCVKSARVASPGARTWRGWVSRDRPAEIPAPGRCPAWPRPPAPGQSRAWCPPPGNGGSSGQLPARETRPRAAPVAACALLMPCEVRYAGQPCGFTGTGALCDNSARGFAWRESWKRRVSRDRPAGPPRRVAVRPGPGRRGPASRARSRAWCPTPGDGGPSGQRPAQETRPRAAPFTACALQVFCRAPCAVRCAGQPCGFTGFARVRWSARGLLLSSCQCARRCRSQGL